MSVQASAVGDDRDLLASTGVLELRLGRRNKITNDNYSSKNSSTQDIFALSSKEIRRYETIILINNNKITLLEAQLLLNISRSQLYKLLSRFREAGVTGITSKKRNALGNRAFPSTVREQVICLIQEKYPDYGPTLAAETLMDLHGIRLSAETLRKWMSAAGLWLRDRAARKNLHQPRRRMNCHGDLIQVDGSDHDWFEGRAPRCTLMVFVDDATSRLQHLMFAPAEDREAYFISTHQYIQKHGRPVRIVTDKHRAAWSGNDKPSEYTQALNSLGIVQSVAHSPQSKGRVERTHRTLQDRLVKELRRQRICSIEAANKYVAEFMDRYNQRFARIPANSMNSHRPIQRRELDQAFSRKFLRRLSRQLTFSFQGARYALEVTPENIGAMGRRVLIECHWDGSMVVTGANGPLNYRQI